MRWKNTLVAILSVVGLIVLISFGTFFGVSFFLNQPDTGLDTSDQQNFCYGADLIGRIVSKGSNYLSIALYTPADIGSDAAYDALHTDSLIPTGVTRFIILRSDAEYFRMEAGERYCVTLQMLSLDDYIAVTLGEDGKQIILLLSGDTE